MVKPIERDSDEEGPSGAAPRKANKRSASSAWSAAESGAPAGLDVPEVAGGPEHGDSTAGSLFDAMGPADADNPYGVPGVPVSTQSALYRGFWSAIGVGLAVVLGIAINEAAAVLELILVSFFLAVGLNPIVELLIRRGAKRGWAVLVVATVLIGVVTLVLTVLIGVLQDQLATFINDAPKLLQDLRKHRTIAHLDNRYHIISSLEQKLRDPNLAEDTFGGVYNAGLTVFRALANALVTFVLTLYFLAALPKLKHALFSLAPASRRERVGQLGDEILRRVGRFVIGAFLVALIAGTVSFLFLLSVGLSVYALPLAIAVALLDLVPLVGSITGAAIVCLVCLANSLTIGIAALIFYAVYETLEGYVIYPRVMRSSVDVPEYLTIVAVLLGGAIGGIVGALLALPIAAAVLLLAREVWVRKQDRS